MHKAKKMACLSSQLSSAAAHRSAKTLTLASASPASILLRHAFSSSDASPSAAADAGRTDPDSNSAWAAAPTPESTPSHRWEMSGEKEEPLHETICYMMAKRPWTTRLQNSIRNLVPIFDQALVLAILRTARKPDHALRFFRWVEKTGFRHDAETYQEIISLLTRAYMINHARCLILDDMPDRLVSPTEDMLAALIDAYGRARIPQEAVKMFRRLPELGITRTARSYDAIFKAILRSGRVAMAKRIFNAMLREGVAPVRSTYNILLWGFGVSINMVTAQRFFLDMKERGIAPDLLTYNTMLNGWVRARKMDNAEKVFAEMSAAGFTPNSISYNIMIKGYIGSGMVDDGLRMFSEMREKRLRPSEKTFAGLMPGLCDDVGRAAEARDILREMAERRLTPKDKSIFLRLVSSLCESGDLEGSLEVHQKMSQFKHVVVEPTHYSVLIESLCKGGKYDSASALVDEFLEKESSVLSPQSSTLEPSAYNPMIKYLCDHGDTKKAEAFFRQLMKKGINDEVAFNNIICGHAKEGMPESAAEFLTIMTRCGVATEVDSYALMVESFLKKSEPADAKTALDNMMEQGHLPSASLFRSVMVALFDDGRVQTASRVMKRMIEKGVKENMDVAHKILEALFMRGHVEEALGRINLMIMNDCTPDIERLLTAVCEADKVFEAQRLVEFTLDINYDVSFSNYDRVLDMLHAAGKTLPAYSILSKIKAKGGIVSEKGCDALIKSLNAEGKTKQADILSRILAGKAPAGTKNGKRVAREAC